MRRGIIFPIVDPSKFLYAVLDPLYASTLSGALPVPFAAVRVARLAFVAHRYSDAPPGCRPFSIAGLLYLTRSLWTDHVDRVFDSGGLAGLREGSMLHCWPGLLSSCCFLLFSLYLHLIVRLRFLD